MKSLDYNQTKLLVVAENQYNKLLKRTVEFSLCKTTIREAEKVERQSL